MNVRVKDPEHEKQLKREEIRVGGGGGGECCTDIVTLGKEKARQKLNSGFNPCGS